MDEWCIQCGGLLGSHKICEKCGFEEDVEGEE